MCPFGYKMSCLLQNGLLQNGYILPNGLFVTTWVILTLLYIFLICNSYKMGCLIENGLFVTKWVILTKWVVYCNMDCLLQNGR